MDFILNQPSDFKVMHNNIRSTERTLGNWRRAQQK